MRGAHQRLRFILGEIGIIPACAGSTFVIVYPPRFSRDHPRMCGEHLWMQASTGATSGSSPHVRGARSAWVIGAVFAGIIPACAGSTSPWPSASARCGDHPRMCGEHSSGPALIADIPGSSPHVRGARGCQQLQQSYLGIIPACAGSTCHDRRENAGVRDHPRMYGEHTSEP